MNLNHELWETLSSYINKIISLPAPMLYRVFGFRWASVIVRFSGRTVRSTNELTSQMANLPEKHGEIWIKTVNFGDLWSRSKRSKTQYNIGTGKEIILLIYVLNVSHRSCLKFYFKTSGECTNMKLIGRTVLHNFVLHTSQQRSGTP